MDMHEETNLPDNNSKLINQFLQLLYSNHHKIYGYILSLAPIRFYADDIMQEATWITHLPLGNALEFDGLDNDDYVGVPDVSNDVLNTAGDFSISLWAKCTDTNSDYTLVFKGAPANDDNYIRWMWEDNERLLFRVRKDNGHEVSIKSSSASPLIPDSWNHIVVTVDRSAADPLDTVHFYVNNLLTVNETAGQRTFTIDPGEDIGPGEGDIMFGLRYQTGTFANEIYGDLDDIRFYDHVLTASEIEDLYTVLPTYTVTMDVQYQDPNNVITGGPYDDEDFNVSPSAGVTEFVENQLVTFSAQESAPCPDRFVFSHWTDVGGLITETTSPETSITITQDMLVTAVFYPVEDEKVCGDVCHPILAADLNGDCHVDLRDFSMFAATWLMSTRPEDD